MVYASASAAGSPEFNEIHLLNFIYLFICLSQIVSIFTGRNEEDCGRAA